MQQSHSAIIIDGSSSARKILASIIRQQFKMDDVYTSATGREASGVLRQISKVDWIFCDNKLTDQDTYDFLTSIKKIKSTVASKVILLSTNTEKEALMKAASHGINDIILKPFTPKIILEKVKKLVDGESQRSSKRISLLEAFEAKIEFKTAKYKSALIDLSLGGCMAKTPVFSQGGMVYDRALIRIPLDKKIIKVNAELIKLERDSSSDSKILRATFIFEQISPETAKILSEFLSTMNSGFKRK